jgi:hypothetical protein
MGLGRYEDAKKCLIKAINLKKDYFQAYNNYNAMIDGWSNVMNLPRYKNCKRFIYAKYNRGMKPKDIVNNICKCFWKSGYHTSNQWKVRSNISTEYWTVKASFPNLEY